MTGAYSKGPWFAELGSDGTFGLYARTPTRGTQLIAEFYDQDMGDHLPAQANLTMAAAAPDLLAALIALSGNIGAASLARNKHGQMLRANAEAAIAKAIAAATGEVL